MNHIDEGIDLSPLDPERDPSRLDRVVNRVLARLGPEMVREEPTLSHAVSLVLARRYRLICATAAMVFLTMWAATEWEAMNPDRRAEAAGLSLPPEWSLWVVTERIPSTANLLFAGAGERE